MAVNFKEINDELHNAPLSDVELTMINNVEVYIDKEILKKFTGSDVSIDLRIITFDYDPLYSKMIYLPDARKKLMRKELENRYKNAGWKFRVQMDDMLDGPNMSGPDLWILTGKNK